MEVYHIQHPHINARMLSVPSVLRHYGQGQTGHTLFTRPCCFVGTELENMMDFEYRGNDGPISMPGYQSGF